MSVNAVMAQTFLPGVTIRNTGVSIGEIQVLKRYGFSRLTAVYTLCYVAHMCHLRSAAAIFSVHSSATDLL